MSWHSSDWMKLLGGLAAGAAVLGTAGGATPGLAALLGGGAGAGAGTGAAAAGAAGAGSGLAGLVGSSLGKAAIGAGTSAALGAAMPSYGMTSPGNVPQMPSEDPMIALQQLMQKSKLGGRI